MVFNMGDTRVVLAFKVKSAARDQISQLARSWNVTLSEAARLLMSKGIEHMHEIDPPKRSL